MWGEGGGRNHELAFHDLHVCSGSLYMYVVAPNQGYVVYVVAYDDNAFRIQISDGH